VPDFRTINRFRVRHRADFAMVLRETVRLAQAAGLVRLGLVAIGTKLRANTSRSKAMSHRRRGEAEARLAVASSPPRWKPCYIAPQRSQIAPSRGRPALASTGCTCALRVPRRSRLRMRPLPSSIPPTRASGRALACARVMLGARFASRASPFGRFVQQL
jgi:hypothetical protein